MGGRPVWLASIARRKPSGQIIPTAYWSPAQMRLARKVAYEYALAGVGDLELERGFRMCATLCVHRSLTDAEIAAMPASCRVPAVDLAGGPIEVLWRTPKVNDAPSTLPCASPTRVLLPGTNDPELYFPNDCGECESCKAREAARQRAQELEPPLTPAVLAPPGPALLEDSLNADELLRALQAMADKRRREGSSRRVLIVDAPDMPGARMLREMRELQGRAERVLGVDLGTAAPDLLAPLPALELRVKPSPAKAEEQEPTESSYSTQSSDP